MELVNFDLFLGGMHFKVFHENIFGEPQWGSDSLDHVGALKLNISGRVVNVDCDFGNNLCW